MLNDLNVPVMDGYELALAIRQHEAGSGRSRTPIMALRQRAAGGGRGVVPHGYLTRRTLRGRTSAIRS